MFDSVPAGSRPRLSAVLVFSMGAVIGWAAPPPGGFAAGLSYTCPAGTLPDECVAIGTERASIRWFQLVAIPGLAKPAASANPKDLHGARQAAAGLGLAVALKAYRDPLGTLDPGGDRYDAQIRERAQQILFFETSFVTEHGRSLTDFCAIPGCAMPELVRADLDQAAGEIRDFADRIFKAQRGQGLGPRPLPVPGFAGLEGRSE